LPPADCRAGFSSFSALASADFAAIDYAAASALSRRRYFALRYFRQHAFPFAGAADISSPADARWPFIIFH